MTSPTSSLLADADPAADDGDGRSRRWDAHREQRRAELTRAARKAVHRGGPDLSMDELATAMGTSKSIVYRYFTDKSGLQAAVGAIVLDEIAESLAAASRREGSATQRMREMVEIYIGTITHSPNVYRFLTSTHQTAPAEGEAMTSFLTNVADAVSTPLRELLGEADPDGDLSRLWASGMVGFVRGAGETWLMAPPERRQDPEVMVELVTAWLWRGASSASRIRSNGASA